MSTEAAYIPLFADVINKDVREVERLRGRYLTKQNVERIELLNARITKHLHKLFTLKYDGSDVDNYKTLLKEYLITV